MYNAMYFRMIPWMKPKTEMSSIVVEETRIYS